MKLKLPTMILSGSFLSWFLGDKDGCLFPGDLEDAGDFLILRVLFPRLLASLFGAAAPFFAAALGDRLSIPVLPAFLTLGSSRILINYTSKNAF